MPALRRGDHVLARHRDHQAAPACSSRDASSCDAAQPARRPQRGRRADEIAWAFRKLLEEAARERPLVVVFDDLQWAEATFLDLIEHVADLSRGAPILLLCMARPELLDRRPGWAGGKLNATNVLLEPLSSRRDAGADRSSSGRAVDDALRGGSSTAAEGNPLFVEEMVALVRESGAERRLRPAHDPGAAGGAPRPAGRGRARGAGTWRGRGPDLPSRCGRRRWRPSEPRRRRATDRPGAQGAHTSRHGAAAGDDAFRFRHLLIRDAAYDALPKVDASRSARALRATGSRSTAPALPSWTRSSGYHLEQACRYRRELGQPSDEELASRARRHLITAGRRAYARADFGAAVALLERASALLARDAIDIALSVDLTNALTENGRGDDALLYTTSLAARARSAGDRGAELCGLILAGIIRTFREPEGAADYLDELVEEAIPYFENRHDDLGLYVAYHARGQAANIHAQAAAGVEAYDRAAEYAGRLGLADQFLAWRSLFRILGTTPASEFLSWFETQTEGKPRLLAAEHFRATALAMLGRIDEARSVIGNSLRELEDRGAPVAIGETLGFGALPIELLAGDTDAAVAAGEESCRLLEASGQLGYLSQITGMLARALWAADRLDSAEAWALRSLEWSTSEDLAAEMIWRQAKGLVLARRGEHVEAQKLAQEAVSIGAQTQHLDGQGETYWDLAQVLMLGDRPAEAAEALRQALDRYERKENLVMAERARRMLESLG